MKNAEMRPLLGVAPLWHRPTANRCTRALLRAGLLMGMAADLAAQGASSTTTGPVGTARYQHTATLLPSGKVLVAGGFGVGGVLSSAEVYDPSTGTWTATGSLGTARQGHTATLLPSGKVLVAGGNGGRRFLPSAEVYDPSTGTWTATRSLGTARFSHTATLLPSDKVLVPEDPFQVLLASAPGKECRTCGARQAAPIPPPALCGATPRSRQDLVRGEVHIAGTSA